MPTAHQQGIVIRSVAVQTILCQNSFADETQRFVQSNGTRIVLDHPKRNLPDADVIRPCQRCFRQRTPDASPPASFLYAEPELSRMTEAAQFVANATGKPDDSRIQLRDKKEPAFTGEIGGDSLPELIRAEGFRSRLTVEMAGLGINLLAKVRKKVGLGNFRTAENPLYLPIFDRLNGDNHSP